MKKIVYAFIGASLLSSYVSASELMRVNNYKDEFQKMENFINSMMASHLTHAKLVNIGYPRVNVQNKKDVYIYEFDIAGVPKENIQLSIDENNLLTLKGKKENKTENKSQNYMRQEIYYGSFSRVMQLPEDIDQNKLETKYNNGILQLTLGKKEIKKIKSKILQIK